MVSLNMLLCFILVSKTLIARGLTYNYLLKFRRQLTYLSTMYDIYKLYTIPTIKGKVYITLFVSHYYLPILTSS